MKQGLFLYGVCKGFLSEPWSKPQTGASGVNYTLGVARVYEDKWGQEQEEIVNVSVNKEDADRINELANKFKGKPVEVQVFQMARTGGKNGAWLSTILPKGGLIALAATSTELKAAG